ncbi:MAG: N-acetyl-gamma-glutamyl-phosphate reductase [Candidatus Wallbacteria bacterium]|nr:N-acetyl-gamma-glutamyl-phosphate reductase [Candidatus Wallbacteria bacterium]
MPRKRVAILGATGYGGSELLRFLLFHPGVTVARLTSRQHPGVPVHEVHPNLLKVTDLKFENLSPEEAAEGVDMVFSALPHGASQDSVRRLPERVKAIDLSGDFRLKDAAVYRDAYGHEHNAPELLGHFVYGLTEFNRRAIAQARRVANPGCFATGALLALLPLAHAGALEGAVTVAGVTGSSGSGAEAKPGTHHPERAAAFRAYKPLVHQHLPEIAQELARAGAPEARISFVPHSAPMVRGIHITAVLHPAEPLSLDTIRSIYASHYGEEKFVRLRPQPPDVAVVAGSNFADVHCHGDGRALVVLVALDNLVKGMVGQAIQNMNLMLGFPEATGLEFPGTRP